MKSLCAAILAVLPTTLSAASQCVESSEAYERLAVDFHEARVLVGVAGDGNVMFELWASVNGATWTALITDATGTSCMIASGSDLMSALSRPEPNL